MRRIQLIYFYYFLLSGTRLKFFKHFILIDIIFLILLPLMYMFRNILNEKKLTFYDGIMIFISFFYFLQISFQTSHIFQEIIYYIPIILGYSFFFKSKLLKKDYKNFTIMIVLFLLTTFFVESGHNMYKTGVFYNSIAVGFFSVLGIYIVNYSNFSKLNIKLFELFFIGMIFYSNTRGSMVAILVFYILKKGLNIKKITKMVMILISGFLLLVTFNLIKLEKIFNKYNDKKLDLTTGRTIIWRESYNYYSENNILGSGLGHYNLISNLKKRVGFMSSHNGYIDIFISFGVILGSIIIIILLCRIIKNRKKSKLNLAILVSILVLNLGESIIFFTRVPITLVFWISFGNLERMRLKKKLISK